MKGMELAAVEKIVDDKSRSHSSGSDQYRSRLLFTNAVGSTFIGGTVISDDLTPNLPVKSGYR